LFCQNLVVLNTTVEERVGTSKNVKKIRKIRTSDINLELRILYSRKGSKVVLQVEKL